MLGELIQSAYTFMHTDTTMYGLAGVGLCAFVGLYYLGEYLFSDIEPEPDAIAD